MSFSENSIRNLHLSSQKTFPPIPKRLSTGPTITHYLRSITITITITSELYITNTIT